MQNCLDRVFLTHWVSSSWAKVALSLAQAASRAKYYYLAAKVMTLAMPLDTVQTMDSSLEPAKWQMGTETCVKTMCRTLPATLRIRSRPSLARPSGSSQSDHWLFFRLAQDVADIDGGYLPHAEINVPGRVLVGRFSGDPHWPVLGDP
jgi:hypothetical protein